MLCNNICQDVGEWLGGALVARVFPMAAICIVDRKLSMREQNKKELINGACITGITYSLIGPAISSWLSLTSNDISLDLADTSASCYSLSARGSCFIAGIKTVLAVYAVFCACSLGQLNRLAPPKLGSIVYASSTVYATCTGLLVTYWGTKHIADIVGIVSGIATAFLLGRRRNIQFF